MSVGHLNSPKFQTWLAKGRARKEQKLKRIKEERQARMEEQRRRRELRELRILAYKEHIRQLREIWGSFHSPETRAKMSQARKGCIPWNKGFKAWNSGLEWSDEVKNNISKVMIVYWQQRKQQQQ